jgi:hypothetical protein
LEISSGLPPVVHRREERQEQALSLAGRERSEREKISDSRGANAVSVRRSSIFSESLRSSPPRRERCRVYRLEEERVGKSETFTVCTRSLTVNNT